MNALADEFGLVVAYPHQPRAANPSGCWNWFDKRHQHRGSGEPARLAGLVQSLASEFAIPRERTFVAGLSAGVWSAAEDGLPGEARQPDPAGLAWLVARTSTIAGGTNEMQLNQISERVLGLPREATPDRDVPFAQIRQTGR